MTEEEFAHAVHAGWKRAAAVGPTDNEILAWERAVDEGRVAQHSKWLFTTPPTRAARACRSAREPSPLTPSELSCLRVGPDAKSAHADFWLRNWWATRLRVPACPI